jgi:hypothetical protein
MFHRPQGSNLNSGNADSLWVEANWVGTKQLERIIPMTIEFFWRRGVAMPRRSSSTVHFNEVDSSAAA